MGCFWVLFCFDICCDLWRLMMFRADAAFSMDGILFTFRNKISARVQRYIRVPVPVRILLYLYSTVACQKIPTGFTGKLPVSARSCPSVQLCSLVVVVQHVLSKV